MRVQSNLLTNSENGLVGKLLGKGCESWATTIAQLYRSRAPHHKKWYEGLIGVVCLVQDFNTKSFWIRVYDMDKRQMAFQQQLYHTIRYKSVRPAFHTFSAPDDPVGLNFADLLEADYFAKAVDYIKKAQMARLKELGWNETAGYDEKKAPNHLKTFLERAGAQQIANDKESMNFIMDFIEKNGKIDAIIMDNNAAEKGKVDNKGQKRRAPDIPSKAKSPAVDINDTPSAPLIPSHQQNNKSDSEAQDQSNETDVPTGESTTVPEPPNAKRRALSPSPCPTPTDIFRFYEEYIETPEQSVNGTQTQSKPSDQITGDVSNDQNILGAEDNGADKAPTSSSGISVPPKSSGQQSSAAPSASDSTNIYDNPIPSTSTAPHPTPSGPYKSK